MRRRVMLFAVVLLALTLCVGSTAADAATYRMGSHYAAGYFVNNGFSRMNDRIREATNGEVDIRFYESSQLGDYEQVFQEVMRGTIDMQAMFPVPRFNKKFEICVTPGLASGYDELGKLWRRGSPFHKFMEEAYAEIGVVYIGTFVDTLMVASIARGKEIASPYDNSNKQCEMRVLPVDALRAWYRAMGYQVVTVPYTEVFTSMQTGILGGDCNSGPEGVYVTFKDVTGTIIEYPCTYVNLDFVISKKVWDSFSDETKQIIIDAFDAEWVNVFNESKGSYDKYLNMMRDEGIKIISPNAEQIAEMERLAREESWPICAKATGEAIFDEILEYMGKK